MPDDLIDCVIDATGSKALLARYTQLQTLEERQAFLGELLVIYSGFLEEPGEHMSEVVSTVRRAVLLILEKILPTGASCDILDPFVKQVERLVTLLDTSFAEYVQEDSFRRKDALHGALEKLCTWKVCATVEAFTVLFLQEYNSIQLYEIVLDGSTDPVETLCRRFILALEKIVRIMQCSDELLRYSPWYLKVVKLYTLLMLACPRLCAPRMFIIMGYKHLTIAAKAQAHTEYFYTDTAGLLSIAASSYLLQDANYNYTMAFNYCLLALAYIYNDFTEYPFLPDELQGQLCTDAFTSRWQLMQPMLLLVFTDFATLYSTFEKPPKYLSSLVSLMVDTLESEEKLEARRKDVLARVRNIRAELQQVTVHMIH